MSVRRVLRLIAGDLRMGLRSPVILWLLVMPVAISFLIQMVLVTLLDPQPRLCVTAPEGSEVVSILETSEGLRLSYAGTREEMLLRVEENKADLGLSIYPGFEGSVMSGQKPELDLFISGRSLASSRLMIGLMIIGALRDITEEQSPVEVVVHREDSGMSVSMEQKIVPAIVLFVMIIAGIFVPAFMLVQEKESGTIRALLVTPVTMSELLCSKMVLGFFMTLLISLLTLALNGAIQVDDLSLMTAIAAGTVQCTAIGLVYGTVSRDAKTLYALVKSLNILLVGPMVFYFFPGFPQWIAKIFPTYWFIDPLYRITALGDGLALVWRELLLAVGISALIVVLEVPLARRMQNKLAS